MDELATLFLRGKYAEDMKKFLRIVRAFALFGLVLMGVSALLSWQESVPFWVVAVVSVFGFAVEGVANILDLFKPSRLGQLCFEQNEENALQRAGKERARHEAVYRASRLSFSGFSSGKRFWVLGFTRIFAPTALAVCCLFVSSGAVLNDALLYVFVVFALLSGGAGVYDALLESRARAKFYSLAQSEIDEIKREELHISSVKVMKEAETARAASSLPAPVELFLKEDTEREDFRRVSKQGGLVGFLLGVMYFVAIALCMICGNAVEALGAGAAWSIVLGVFAAIFAVSIVAIFPISRRQNEIYARNLSKLGESDADALRAELQKKWLNSQRAGNIMFACFMAVAVGLGIALGLVAYLTGEEGGMPLSQSLAVAILPILVYAALLSLVVWAVMYAIARRRMRPTENKLRERMRTERS